MADAAGHIPYPKDEAKFRLRGSKKLLDESLRHPDDEPLDEVLPGPPHAILRLPDARCLRPGVEAGDGPVCPVRPSFSIWLPEIPEASNRWHT